MSVSGDDVNTAITAIPAIKKVIENIGYVLTGVLVIAGLGYRIGKEHAKYQKLCLLLEKVVEQQEKCVTREELLEKQISCRGKVSLEIQDQIHVLNSNVCLIMGHQGITPVIANPIDKQSEVHYA